MHSFARLLYLCPEPHSHTFFSAVLTRDDLPTRLACPAAPCMLHRWKKLRTSKAAASSSGQIHRQSTRLLDIGVERPTLRATGARLCSSRGAFRTAATGRCHNTWGITAQDGRGGLLRLRGTVDRPTVAVGASSGPRTPLHAGTGSIATGGPAYVRGRRVSLLHADRRACQPWCARQRAEPSIGCDRRPRQPMHPTDPNYSNGLPARRTRAHRPTGVRSVQRTGCEASSLSDGSIDLP
jgi:hypothetical protein